MSWTSNLDSALLTNPPKQQTAELHNSQAKTGISSILPVLLIYIPSTHSRREVGATSWSLISSAQQHLQNVGGCWLQAALHQLPVCSAAPAAAWYRIGGQELKSQPAGVCSDSIHSALKTYQVATSLSTQNQKLYLIFSSHSDMLKAEMAPNW